MDDALNAMFFFEAVLIVITRPSTSGLRGGVDLSCVFVGSVNSVDEFKNAGL